MAADAAATPTPSSAAATIPDGLRLCCHFQWDVFNKEKFGARCADMAEGCLKQYNAHRLHPVLCDFLGVLAMYEKRYPAAKQYFEEALQLEPGNPIARGNLIYLLRNKLKLYQDADKQEATLHALVMANEQHCRAMLHWSMAFYHMHMFELTAAKEQCALALAVKGPDEHAIQVKILQATVLNRLDEYKGAAEILEPLSRREDLPDAVTVLVCTQLARAHLKWSRRSRRQSHKALYWLKRGLELSPQDVDLLKYKGEAIVHAKGERAAINFFTGLMTADIKHTFVYHQCGTLHRKIKEFDRAKQCCGEQLKSRQRITRRAWT